MKKILFSAIAIAAMAVSCQVEKLDEGAAPSGQTVRITAELPSDDSKTIFNPEDKTVAWEESDELTVVVNSSSAYKFTKETGSNTFTASGVSLAEGTNTYHVLYPYNEHVTKVDAGVTDGYINIPSTAAAVQNGVNSTSHIKGVMYGYTTADGSASPSVQMHQLTALLKIDVTNNHTEPIEVRSITVSTDATGQLLSGTYYINLETGETVSRGDTYTYNYTTLGVSNVTMEAGATGTFWVSAHPFDVPQGSTLTISMETDKGVASDDRTYDRDLHFSAGTVNTASFNFENPVQTIEKLTVAEFLAKPVDASVYYELTGTVENISSDYHGNFDLTDETGSVYVYGISSAKGAGDKNVLETLGIKEGDILTLCGTRGEYGSTIEVMDAYYISHEATPYCNVTPSTMSVTAEAGTTTFNISSNEYWMIESNNPAYTVSPEDGTGDATITITYPANEGADPVEVVFTVLSDSGVEKTVTLTQRTASQTTVEVTDVLTSDLFAATSTSYTAFSDVSVTSSAVYAGQTATDDGTIQLRSKASNDKTYSGIVTTSSNGKVKKVVIAWNTTKTTNTSRTVDIYGKNEPFTTPDEMYNTSLDKIGSISLSSGPTGEVVISGDYSYIGLRSKDGALYLDSISITWEE